MMSSKKYIKRYFCPYCGKDYEDNKWSIDHIIPLQIGGPKKFKILSCSDCNLKISREIEQLAIQTPSMRHQIIQARSNGFQIKTRRKIDNIPMHRGIGFSHRMPVKMYYSIKEDSVCLGFMGNLLNDMTPEEFKNQLSSGQAIIPADNDTEKDTILLASLVSKIILGTCCWLWGGEFARSSYGDSLRKSMWENRMEHILELEPSDHHITLMPEESEEEGDIENKEIDAFGNCPDNTIYIYIYDDVVFGLVNLFGEFESVLRIGKVNLEIDIGIVQKGTVVIASTTKNQVLTMTLDEYKRFKSKQLMSCKDHT